MVLLQCPQEEEALMNFLYQAGGVGGPGQVLRDVGHQEFEAGDSLDGHPVDMDGWDHTCLFSSS